MSDQAPQTQQQTIFLKDYRPPAYYIPSTELYFDLRPGATRVRSRLQLSANPMASDTELARLSLHGQSLKLIALSLDGNSLSPDQYQLDDETLVIELEALLGVLPRQFELQIETEICPENNRSLEGLYQSSGMYCTQCEAEGFRKITYYLDRPDVMSEFTTHIEADAEQYPVMLSNGNKTEDKTLPSGRRCVSWHDPFKKPAYLFALVAGQLQKVSDSFTTKSGREVCLEIYVEAKDLDKCQHAMDSLKNSMAWDERVYGREYDLDIFMVVAVDDFNMGAMENKGLNIFNTSCVLAKAETTTDAAFQRVEGVVAHEYFHNWSGNRVTCRDWFQLSLKEGFTVFRDAQFSADMGSPTVKRVEDVSLLRSAQFPEDGGPLAHAVQPASFIEISNFYTLTIYEKGAELVRMIHTLLGPETFRRGSDLYFDRHDGQAVTIDDFLAAMADASGRNLDQFKLWYHQAGTPQLTVSESYDESAQEYTLSLSQYCRPTPETEIKQAYLIPVSVSLFGDAGALPLKLKGQRQNPEVGDNTSMVLEFDHKDQSYCFENIAEKPVASVLRGFSAPVKVEFKRDQGELLRLMSQESDGFARWDACQQVLIELIGQLQQQRGDKAAMAQLIEPVQEAFAGLLADDSLDPAMVALMLTLPSLNYLLELAEEADVLAIYAARETLRQALAEALYTPLMAIYKAYDHSLAYQPSADQIAKRSLKNTALSYLMLAADIGANDERRAEVLALCQQQYQAANNMTDQQAALLALVHSDFCQEQAQWALSDFYQRWQHEALVVNLWFSIQASRPARDALAKVEQLAEHPAFDRGNPNKVRALLGVFCNQNTYGFHASADGAAYRYLAEQVLSLDGDNPQLAARLLTPLTRWAKFAGPQRQGMRNALEGIAASATLSKDVYELVNKSLG